MSASPSSGGDLVALAERQRWLLLLRLSAALLAAVLPRLLRDAVPVAPSLVVIGSYAAAAAGGWALWRASRRRGLWLLGALLLVDGLFLGWVSWASGGMASPMRALMVVHVVAVALLASYRTALKAALWDALVLLTVGYAQEAGVLAVPAAEEALHGGGLPQTTAFIILAWAAAVATASFSAVNERELRRRRFDLEALAALATDLDQALGPDAVAETTLRHLADTFGFGRAVLVDADPDRAAVLSAIGLDVKPGDRLPGRTVGVASTVLLGALHPEQHAGLLAVLPDARNVVVAPLTAEGTVVAVLAAEHGGHIGARVERRVIETVERFLAHAALSLRNAALVEQLTRQAATDGLTGVANRRTLEVALAARTATASPAHPVSAILLDLDHFKRLNDEHGHLTGDDVLRITASVLQRTAPADALVARYGGEEFCVLLPGRDLPAAIAVAHEIGAAIRSAPTPVLVTASLGVAVASGPTTPVELLAAADAELYAAKLAGRDRVFPGLDTPHLVPIAS